MAILNAIFGIAGIGGILAGFTQGWGYYLLLIPIGFMTLFIAPYMVWRKEKNRTDQAEDRARPRLKIEKSFDENLGTFGQNCALLIANEGSDNAEDCQGRLEAIAFLKPKKGLSFDRWPTNRNLVMDTNIAGNTRAALHVIHMIGGDPSNPELQIAYKDNDQFRHSNAIPNDEEILLVVSVSSKNTKPLFAVCLLSPRVGWGYGWQMIRDNLTERPDITTYQQLESRKEDYQN